jgi:hypothetical protein
MKTQQFYNKNQFIIRDENKTVFQSYNSIIAIYENRKLTLGIDWDYSHTTQKHLYLFINDYVSIKELDVLNQKKNKRAYIQKLIDTNIISYDASIN